MASFCKNCGKPLKAGINFCTFCGADVKPPEPVAEPVKEVVTETVAQPVNEATETVVQTVAQTETAVTQTVKEATQTVVGDVKEVPQAVPAPSLEPVQQVVQEPIQAAPVQQVVQEPVQAAPVQQVVQEPVQAEPVQQAAAQPQEQSPYQNAAPKKKKKRNFLQVLVSFILILLFACSVTCFLGLNSLDKATVEDTVGKVMGRVDLTNTKVASFGAKDSEDNFDWYFYQRISKADREKTGFDSEDVKNIMQDPAAKEALSDIGKKVITSIYDNKEESVSSEYLAKLVLEKSDAIYELTGYKVSESDVEPMEKFFDANLNLKALDYNSSNNSSSGFIRFALSNTGRYIVIGVMVLLAVLILVVNRRNFGAGLRALGIGGLIAGLISGIVCGLMAYTQILATVIGTYYADLVRPIWTLVVNRLLVPTAICAGVSLLLLIIGSIMMASNAKKLWKQNAAK